MTSLISIRLNDKLLQTAKANARRLRLTQTDYIRKSIELMNESIEKKEREKRLKNASLKVRKESMRVNEEFDRIEYDPESE
jgi:hypothetical protein